jgi:hypothetical protein
MPRPSIAKTATAGMATLIEFDMHPSHLVLKVEEQILLA